MVVVVSGHPQPPHRDGHPCTVEVLPGPTVRLGQSANPVVVWLGLVSRVVRSSWSRGVLVQKCLYPNMVSLYFGTHSYAKYRSQGNSSRKHCSRQRVGQVTNITQFLFLSSTRSNSSCTYVDDIKIAGRKANLVPTPLIYKVYLGCTQRESTTKTNPQNTLPEEMLGSEETS